MIVNRAAKQNVYALRRLIEFNNDLHREAQHIDLGNAMFFYNAGGTFEAFWREMRVSFIHAHLLFHFF